MAQSIPVKANDSIIYHIELVHDFSMLPTFLQQLGYGRTQKICIVTDSNVAPLYAREVQNLLEKEFDTVILHVFEAGDFMQYKNMVGAFYQPKLVYMNLSVLQSLPSRQIVSGMGEIIKHGLIKDAAYYEWLMAHHDAILALEPAVMEEMIARSCDIKREVVEHDPTEKGERALLNFGHTIGHAIEKLCGFSLYHGECVGLGILAAAYLSQKQGNLTKEQLAGISQCLSAFGFQTQIDGISPDAVLSATKSDKKMIGNQVKFILLHTIGDAYIYRELSDEQILDGIRYVCRA